MKSRFFIALTLLALLPAIDVHAQPTAPAEEYDACLKLAQAKPQQALESARSWRDLGGGEPAEHCIAVSLVNLGDFAAGGEVLETLARETERGARMKAAMLAQAGQAWVMADDLDRAQANQSAAIELAPDEAKLWLDRALTRGMAKNYWESVDDLNQALELQPDTPLILSYRATAYRYLDALDLARSDIDRALALSPDNPQALLERGIIARLEGDRDQARRDWLRVIALADGYPVADMARRNLEKMDVDTDR